MCNKANFKDLFRINSVKMSWCLRTNSLAFRLACTNKYWPIKKIGINNLTHLAHITKEAVESGLQARLPKKKILMKT